MGLLEWMVVLAGVYLASQYLLGPLMVWWTNRVPAEYRFELIDPDQFLAERSDTFRQLHREILDSGFEYAGSSVLEMSHCTTFFSLYYDPYSSLFCTLSSIYSQPSNTTQIEFTRLYDDGSMVNVNNHPLFNIFPGRGLRRDYRFPRINSVPGLLAVAKTLTGARGDARPISVSTQQVFSIMEEYLTAEMHGLISLGLLAGQASEGNRRMTFKGALFFTWKLCWPVKWILETKDRYRSSLALRKAV